MEISVADTHGSGNRLTVFQTLSLEPWLQQVLVENACMHFKTLPGAWKVPRELVLPLGKCKAYNWTIPCPQDGSGFLRAMSRGARSR